MHVCAHLFVVWAAISVYVSHWNFTVNENTREFHFFFFDCFVFWKRKNPIKIFTSHFFPTCGINTKSGAIKNLWALILLMRPCRHNYIAVELWYISIYMCVCVCMDAWVPIPFLFFAGKCCRFRFCVLCAPLPLVTPRSMELSVTMSNWQINAYGIHTYVRTYTHAYGNGLVVAHKCVCTKSSQSQLAI